MESHVVPEQTPGGVCAEGAGTKTLIPCFLQPAKHCTPGVTCSLAPDEQRGQSAAVVLMVPLVGNHLDRESIVSDSLSGIGGPSSLDAAEGPPMEQFSNDTPASNIQKSTDMKICVSQFIDNKNVNKSIASSLVDELESNNMDLDFLHDGLAENVAEVPPSPNFSKKNDTFLKKPQETPEQVILSKSQGFISKPTYSGVLGISNTAYELTELHEAPLVVQQSIPLLGSSPDCGITIERIRNTVIDDYVDAVERITGKKTVIFVGQSPLDSKYVIMFLAGTALVKKMVSQGVRIRGTWLCVTFYQQPATKIIVSDVLPFITDHQIIEACREYGNAVYPQLRRIPAGVRAPHLTGVLSFRRELLLVLNKDKALPDHVAVYSNGDVHKLTLSTDGATCYRCSRKGHLASNCRTILPNKGQKAKQQAEQIDSQGCDVASWSFKEDLSKSFGSKSNGGTLIQAESTNLQNEEARGQSDSSEGKKDGAQTEWKIVGYKHNQSKGKIFPNSLHKLAPNLTLLGSRLEAKAEQMHSDGSCLKEKLTSIQATDSKKRITNDNNNVQVQNFIPCTTKQFVISVANSPPKDLPLDDDDNEGSEELSDQNLILAPGAGKRKKKRKKRVSVAKLLKMDEQQEEDTMAKESSSQTEKDSSNFTKLIQRKGSGQLRSVGSLKEKNQIIEDTSLDSSSQNNLHKGVMDDETCCSIANRLISKLANLRAAKRKKVIQDFLVQYPMLLKIIDKAKTFKNEFKPGGATSKTLNRIKDEIRILRGNANRAKAKDSK